MKSIQLSKGLPGLREARLNQELSANKLAKILDVSLTHVYNMEKHRVRPSVDLLELMADKLYCSTDQLLGRTTDGAQ